MSAFLRSCVSASNVCGLVHPCRVLQMSVVRRVSAAEVCMPAVSHVFASDSVTAPLTCLLFSSR